MYTEPEINDHKLYAVSWRKHFVAWLAWRQWLHDAIGWKFFPEVLTVWDAWPPVTRDGAALVARKISEFRKGEGISAPTPENPNTWTPWSLPEMARIARVESKRREVWDGAFNHAPNYPFDPSRWNPAMPMAAKTHPFRGEERDAAE